MDYIVIDDIILDYIIKVKDTSILLYENILSNRFI